MNQQLAVIESDSASARLLLRLTAAFAILLCGCAPQSTPTYFVPPAPLVAGPRPAIQTSEPAASPSPESVAIPTIILASPTPPCLSDLTYDQDLTIPDGTVVVPGQTIDKRWQVTNSGSCDWDDRYRLRLVAGDPLGAASSMPLYPARAGSQVTLRIVFTAPQEPGTYTCQWQAIDPAGMPFGDAFYMQISVTQ